MTYSVWYRVNRDTDWELMRSGLSIDAANQEVRSLVLRGAMATRVLPDGERPC